MAAVHQELLREQHFTSMGTEISLLLPADASDAGEPVVQLFDEWDRRFSRFRPDSELSILNARAGEQTDVSEPMLAALMAAFDGARATDGIFDPLLASVTSGHDPWMTAADFSAYVAAQERAAQAWRDPARWRRMSILNCAASGRFSSDRTITEYNEDIWHLQPVDPRDP